MLWFSLLVGISSSDAKSAYGSGLPYEVDGLTDAIKTHHFDQAGSTLLRTCLKLFKEGVTSPA